MSWLRRVNNIVSLIGVILVTTATVLWLLLLPQSLRGEAINPYLGLVNAALLGAFAVGLILIPLGVRLFGRTAALVAGGRRVIVILAVTTIANLVIGSHLTYSTIHYMDGVEFCGTSCHVMNPEFAAWKVGNHSGVKCVECHIASGAQGYVEAKANGMRQLVSYIRGKYSRPIPTPVHNLPTAKEMCERCHQPGVQRGDRLRVYEQYGEDEANSRTYSVFLFRVDKIHGAHDGVRVKWKDGKRAATAGFVGGGERYGEADGAADMTCLDCHNRPSHAYETPGAALNKAFATVAIRAALPSAKRVALELLTAPYSSTEEARTRLAQEFPARVKGANAGEAKVLQAIYERNVSPEMNLTWGTHPNHLGHNDSPGCFRCHDEGFKTGGGKAMGQDCDACHSMVASDEARPKILDDLGWKPR
ncbi:MAG: cytochrome c3 family protein [Bryobacteraceae bacterium]